MDYIKVDEDFDTESGNIVERHKQSDHANSSYVKKLQIFSDFASEHDFLNGDVWLSFQDKPLRFISQELSPATTAKDGSAISAGYSYVPVEVLEETGTPEPDAKVMSAIEVALEDGEQTVSQLTRAVNKKEALRPKLEASGGIRTVLAFMEEQGTVTKENNVYTIV